MKISGAAPNLCLFLQQLFLEASGRTALCLSHNTKKHNKKHFFKNILMENSS
jgi:hypothetical protein